MKTLRITVGEKTYNVTVEVIGENSSLPSPIPQSQPASSVTPPSAEPSAAPAPLPAGAGDVPSPMAGVILKINVRQGDKVECGQDLIVLEAMKMETIISASVSGTIKSIEVKEGDSIQEGQILIKLNS
jgi:glutaconyl-CoA/methylmalonyl-CoA decarboxylase subunit gamma